MGTKQGKNGNSKVPMKKGDLVCIFLLWSSPTEPPDRNKFFIEILLELYPNIESTLKKRPEITEPLAMAWISEPVESFDIMHHAKEKFGSKIIDQKGKKGSDL